MVLTETELERKSHTSAGIIFVWQIPVHRSVHGALVMQIYRVTFLGQDLGNLLVIRYLPSGLFKKRQNNDNFYKFPRHEYRGKSSKTGLNTVEKNQITSVLWFLLGMRMNFIKISQFCF